MGRTQRDEREADRRCGDAVRLSRTVSHALRHEPWRYELELDGEGWVPVEKLLEALRGLRRAWAGLERGDLERMVEHSDKTRFELRGDRMRALYGHSVPDRLAKIQARPPERLYHGTSRAALPRIRADGLRPMGRQYVHLSTDERTARQVGRRRDPNPVVLTIRAAEAHEAGVRFYEGNAPVWLADRVPPSFLDEP